MENAKNLNTEKLITISVDEYFDLRTKAEMNAMLLDRLGMFEGRLCEAERRIYELEAKAVK